MGVTLEAYGDAAWRVRLPEGANARAVLGALKSWPGVIDALVTERHAMVTYDPSAPPAGVERAIEAALFAPEEESPRAARHHIVRVRYGGLDLEEVAARVGLPAEEVIARHSSPTYVVAVVGFLPGFSYLRGVDPRLVVPRRGSPRPRIPALSVGLAGPYTAVYPLASPGGWNLVGTALDVDPFDPMRGAAFALGDRVRFVADEP